MAARTPFGDLYELVIYLWTWSEVVVLFFNKKQWSAGSRLSKAGESLHFRLPFSRERQRNLAGASPITYTREAKEGVFQTGENGGVSVFLWNNIVRRGKLDGGSGLEIMQRVLRGVEMSLGLDCHLGGRGPAIVAFTAFGHGFDVIGAGRHEVHPRRRP